MFVFSLQHRPPAKMIPVNRFFLFFLVAHSISAIKILQLTDFHLDVDYSTHGDPNDKCHESGTSSGDLGDFGDYKCDAPTSLVQNAVKSAARMFPSPDLIIWTGDSVPHVEDYNLTYVVNAIQKPTEMIKRNFAGVPVLPTYGNHDHWPSDQYAENDILYARIYDLWKDWLGGDENTKKTFLLGGYYATTFRGARFLVLNTNLYYKYDKIAFNTPHDPAGQFAFMEAELKAAEEQKTPLHVVAHIPPGMYERKANFTWFTEEFNQKFLDLILSHTSTIRWMIFAHHHTDTFHIVRNAKGDAVQVCYLCPAVTPWYSSLGLGANNPAFRVYESDDQWNSVDFTTYYVNLTDLNANPATEWKEEYSFRRAFDLPDLSPTTIDSLIGRMEKEDALFKKYLQFNTVMHEKSTDVSAGDRLGQFCSLKHADYPRYRECLSGSSAITQSSTLVFFSSFLSGFFLFFT